MAAAMRLCTALFLVAAACSPAAPPAPTPAPAPAPPPVALRFDQIERASFNQLAAELALPLFWTKDDGDGELSPSEVAVLWGIEPTSRAAWVKDGAFTERFESAYGEVIARQAGAAEDGLDEAERARRAALRKELAQGRPTLIHSDFSKASAEDRAIVAHILRAAEIIEALHLEQIGAAALAAELPGDPESRMVFHRNQGPWCVAPQTENDPACTAIAKKPEKVSGLYPAWLQKEKDFCEALKKEPNAEKLRHQFHVVEGEAPGKLRAVPYHQAYAEKMKAISEELKQAAAAIVDPKEKAFQTYLLAAAKAFLDDSWEAADESWAAMGALNSKWYLRIGPDEVYFEPCSLKAGFHVSFARINQDSLAWQKKLDPVKQDMEQALADLAGKPYRARQVSFDLPDFIDIIVNAGDSRSPHGATIGQSLPNWGPVANEGRGRTVAMTNLYTDADSQRSLTEQSSSLLCSMDRFVAEPAPQVMGTVLHEAAHNLGPAHEYAVGGKKDREVFGGPLASMLEELKAQTAALYFTDWLRDRKLLEPDFADQAHVRDVTWAFGHISRGMYDADGRGRPYSQLAAIQLGWLVDQKAVVWHADRKAANGSDLGCFELELEAFPAAVEALMKDVGGIKARGDKARAEVLVKTYVDDKGARKALLETITDRWLRAPKASFVYSIDR
jgi:hypothetical protein